MFRLETSESRDAEEERLDRSCENYSLFPKCSHWSFSCSQNTNQSLKAQTIRRESLMAPFLLETWGWLCLPLERKWELLPFVLLEKAAGGGEGKEHFLLLKGRGF